MPDLSDGVNWSETDANNNQAPPNGWPEGMMPSGVNDAARADRGALKRFWNKSNPVQTITPVGNVWTFVTSNTAYPTAYVAGEIYCFNPALPSLGGDQFQVNSLGPKPILRHAQLGNPVPVLAHEFTHSCVFLVYDPGLNAGAGGFVLITPRVPIRNDGGDGLNTFGNLTVAAGLAVGGDILLSRTDEPYGFITRPTTSGFNNLALTAIGNTTLNDVVVRTNTMEVTGQLSANGFKSHAGLGGAFQANFFNIQWTGSAGAHLWIDTTDLGPIVTGSSGNISVGGNISAASLTTSGNITDGGTLAVSGATTLSGTLQVNSSGAGSGGVSIHATAGAIQSDVSGTALYAPNGNVVCENVTTAQNVTVGADLVVNGGYGQFYQGLFVTGAYSGDAGGNTLYVNGSAHITGNLNGHPAMMLGELAAGLGPGEMAVIMRSASGELAAQPVLVADADDLGRRMVYIR